VGAGHAQQEFRYEAWHGHSRPPHIKKAGEMGVLTISESGISFQAKAHGWSWAYQDIRQLKIAPGWISVVTYEGEKWKLGADREYRFELPFTKMYTDAYPFLKSHLDQRFVAAIAERIADPLWEIPAKHLLRLGGDEGVLQIGPKGMAYLSSKIGESRAWRYLDIENVSSSGPFQLTITTYERATTHYGDLKGFNFELKQALGEDRYNDLWLRLNRSKGLKIPDVYGGN